MKFYGKATMVAMGLAFGSMAFGQATPTIDGTLDGSSIVHGSAVSSVYGNAIAQQTQVADFGSVSGSTYNSSNGSQLDAAYGLMNSTTLYLMFTGNLQTNYNHLDLWFDTGLGSTGGQNVLGNFSSGTALANWSGSTLSNGFYASTGITINGNGTTFYANMDSLSGGSWTDTNLGSNIYGATGSGALSGGTSHGIAIAINDSNSVNSINLADTTGMEFAIPLAALGMSSASTVKIIAGINGTGDNFLSNQFLSGLKAPGNLGSINGSTSTVNLSNDGNPMFSVSPQAAPEPGAIAMMGLGLASLVTAFSRRRTR